MMVKKLMKIILLNSKKILKKMKKKIFSLRIRRKNIKKINKKIKLNNH